MTAKSVVNYPLLIVLSLLLSFTLKAQLKADFIAVPTSGCAPVLVNFIDQSTGSPTQWKWDLGNGTISFLQSPSVTYFNSGQYTIKLVVHNANGDSAVLIKSQYISIYAKPVVAFTATPLTGCFPLLVNFTDQSSSGNGTITQWQWDLGDGTISNVQNPSHTYTSPGNYNITLVVTNSFGCSKVLTKAQYITISNGVHADFSSNITSTCQSPVTINFQNLSTGTGVLSYQWDFGDGGTAITVNPSHTYTSTGTFSVRLITTNSSGCKDTITKTDLINIGTYNASFTSPASVCINNQVTFTNTSLPTPASVNWNFGDGTNSTILNPVKGYTAPGIYTVRLIADFGGCLDTAYSTITVFNKPTANFTAPITNACKPPLTVNFTNTTIGGVSYFWNFGDGDTSKQRNPIHTYTSFGFYTVTLIATNANGCTDTLVIPDFVKIQSPKVSINNLPQSRCAPLTWTFSSTITSVDPVVSYEWDFGDGTTSTTPNPTHTFGAGQYDIRLVITTAGGCTDTAIVPKGITSSVKPIPNFIATPRDVCAFQEVFFTDLTTGTVTSWYWEFGDGGTSTDQNPIYRYQDTGYFDVKLRVCNAGCCDTITFKNYIHITPPIANFVVSFDCNNRLSKTFTDKSIGADEWNWNFGDGTTSTLQNPIHTYADTGTYIVTLRVKNYITGCEHSKSQTIVIINEKANFTVSDSVICKYTPVTFSVIGIKLSNIAAFSWDFGDGTTGAGPAITHIYNVSGKYTVRLIVTDIQGCADTLTKALYIQVDGPTAAFTPGVSGSCLLTTIPFTDNSTNDGTHPITTWIWNYGDGIIDTLTAPPFKHLYSSTGNYTVSLKVIDSKGCTDSSILAIPLLISKPIAYFIAVDTLSCPTKNIQFVDSSSFIGNIYFWDFGDGNTSTLMHPAHAYTADGLYTIKLFITDVNGCIDSMIRPNYVKIVSPHSSYNLSDSLSTCPPLLVAFTNTSQNYISTIWNFGDGTSTVSNNPTHIYTNPGTYVTSLTITSPGGCVDVFQKTVVVRGPKGTFTYNPTIGCKPLTVTFVANTLDSLSYIWDFNDGSTNVTPNSVVSHTYTIPGVYLPRMILVDTNGCVFPITGPDTIYVSGAAAKFGIQNNTFCDDAFVNFTDSSVSNDVIVSYAWDFGDGSTSTLQNPTHHYLTTGLYYPKLNITTQNGCTDSVQLSTPVKIVSSPQAAINKTPNGCTALTVTFNGLLSVPDTSAMNWKWNFGNGNISLLKNPPAQLFSISGNYNIQLIATNSSGCMDTVNTSIDAYAIPPVSAGLDTLVCRGKGITLSAAGAVSYDWSPSTGLSCTTCANPVASPDTLTRYFVKGTTSNGCSNIDTVIVNVKQTFMMSNSRGDTLCLGEGPVRLFASGAYTYNWSPATGLSSTISATPWASPTSTTTYRVVGTDDKGCFTDTGFVTVKVFPIPVVDAGDDKTINIGQSIELRPTVSPDVNKVFWTPTESIIQYNLPSVTVKPKQTTEYTIEVRNNGGCKARDKVMVYVLCDGANIFIPNTFTPNGDGVNDIFYPRGTGIFSIKTLRIFSRWGEVMYEKNNFLPNEASAGWNGTFKGKTLTPDVYVYTIDIICENSTIFTLKGNVALLQ